MEEESAEKGTRGKKGARSERSKNEKKINKRPGEGDGREITGEKNYLESVGTNDRIE